MLAAEPKISWSEVTKFVGQLSHDVRNHLNALELQAAYLNEIVEHPEAKEEIKRLRAITGETGAELQKLSALLAKVQVTTMPYLAADFVEDLRAGLARAEGEKAATVEWQISLGQETLEIDPLLLQEAFLELFRNGWTHEPGDGTLVFKAMATPQTIEFTLQEPKAKFNGTTENWGQQPLGRVRHGHYGLGLFRARSIFEAHHGMFRAQFDPAASVLLTTVSLPLPVA